MKTLIIKKSLTAFLVIVLFVVFQLSSNAQVPQGFNYQAIARDGSGNPIASIPIQVKLAVMADSIGTNVYWEELFSSVTTNAFGLFTVPLGKGTRQTTSTVATFSSINWNVTPVFVRTQIFYQGNWKIMGSSRLWSVPYALVANGIGGTLPHLSVAGSTTVMDSALFVVRNNIGQIIFAVYNEGVRIYVDDGLAKGTNKGGFAVGSFGTGKAPSQEYFRVTRDSTRVYVNPNAKGTKGGFAIGGFGVKGSDSYFNLTPTNYFIGQGSGSNTTTGSYNSFFGYQAGMNNTIGGSNVLIGYLCGRNNDSGWGNVFLGTNSGYTNVSGGSNIFIGNESGFNNTSGGINCFMGSYAGYSNTTGTNNIFLGEDAGYNSKSQNGNIFFGRSAGYSHITGWGNTYIGHMVGYYDTLGMNNVFIGSYAGYSKLSGSVNVLVGAYAGENDTIGSNNVMIGPHAGMSATGSYNVFIGESAGYSETGSNKLYIENSSSSSPLIGGDFSGNRVGINRMPTGLATLEVGGTIWANGTVITAGITTWSDVRYKTNVVPLENALSDVMKIQGVRFAWKRSDFPDLNFPDGEQIGVIAQDLEKILPELVVSGRDGYKSVSYEKLCPVLIEAMKEQQKIIDMQRSKIDIQEKELQSVKDRLTQIETLLTK